jgi:catechol 1,2-dioxygenase
MAAQANGTHAPAVSNTKQHKFNPNFTQSVINATGPKATPRIRQLTASLIQHLHDFARENELTVDEWMQGVELVRRFPRELRLAHTTVHVLINHR